MRYRIQPQEIEIPEDDPFKHDLLERKEPAEVITTVLRSVDGPCVLAVDAPWGAGKTTFLRMLSHHLRNQEFPVIEFNAWETDFAGDPFVALSEELTAGLRAYAAATQGDGFDRVKLYKLRQVATDVLRRAAPGAIRVATAGILDVSPLLEKEVGQASHPMRNNGCPRTWIREPPFRRFELLSRSLPPSWRTRTMAYR